MKKLMIIEINDDGLFEKEAEKIMYVPFSQTILFTYIGKKYRNCTPFLLTNFNNTNSKRFEIKENEKQSINLGQICTEFNYFEGDYETNLNWSCKLQFDHFGLYFFQIVFAVKNEEKSSNSRKIVVPTNFDHLIVNPTYTGMSIENQKTKNELTYSRNLDDLLGEAYCEEDKSENSVDDFKIQSFLTVRNHSKERRNSSYSKRELENRTLLNFDSVNMLSLFPTMLGPFGEWEDQFEHFIENGFRAFHIFPIQKIGKSKSLQSISDQLQFNEDIFGKNFNAEKLNLLFSKLRMKHQVFFIIDIVWNHCSVDAEWIYEEPECVYSVNNCPWLTPACILNRSLLELSSILKNKNQLIKTIVEVEDIMALIKVDIFEKYGFHKYFQIDVSTVLKNLFDYFASKETKQTCSENGSTKNEENNQTKTKEIISEMDNSDLPDLKRNFSAQDQSNLNRIDLEEIIQKQSNFTISGRTSDKTYQLANGNSEFIFVGLKEVNIIKEMLESVGCSPFGVVLNCEKLQKHFEKTKKQFSCYEMKHILTQINTQMEKKAKEWIVESLENIKQEIIYRFLKQNIEKISNEYPLVRSYFFELKNGDFVLLNRKSSETSDEYYNHLYFRRKVIVWTDSIQLNYQTQEKCPILWNRMNEYSIKMASIFDGFRIRNYHQTKIETAKYFINNSMLVNESMLLFSEVSSEIQNRDLKFCLKIGVHRFIREIQTCDSLKPLVKLIVDHLKGTSNIVTQIPALSENNYEISHLKALKPLPILFDQTYENQSYHDKLSIHIQLPILAIENWVPLMVGTSRGFDEMYMYMLPNKYDKKIKQIEFPKTQFLEKATNVFIFLNPENLGFDNKNSNAQILKKLSYLDFLIIGKLQF